MKPVTVKSVDISHGVEVKDCIRKECGYKKTFEDRNEDYIKNELEIVE